MVDSLPFKRLHDLEMKRRMEVGRVQMPFVAVYESGLQGRCPRRARLSVRRWSKLAGLAAFHCSLTYTIAPHGFVFYNVIAGSFLSTCYRTWTSSQQNNTGKYTSTFWYSVFFIVWENVWTHSDAVTNARDFVMTQTKHRIASAFREKLVLSRRILLAGCSDRL